MTNQAIMPRATFAPIVEMVLDGLDSPHSRRAYQRAITDFLSWYEHSHHEGLSRRIVARYIATLRDEVDMAPAYINLRLVAIRRLAREAAENQLIDWQTAIAIERLEGVRSEGHKTGTWLTKQQAMDLIDAPDRTTVKGQRDRALLGVLIGTGVRREEVTSLTCAHIRQHEGRWAIMNLVGKRHKVRSIPMSSWTKVLLDAWLDAAGIADGPLFRAMDRGDHVTARPMSPQAVYDVVKFYIAESGLAVDAAPHDLRRTFAKLAHKGGASVEQISLSLGHESIETTQRYLGIEQNFQDAPCDHLGLQLTA